MTETQEMAQAIHEKHKALWPLTWAVADFMAKQLAGDQGYLIVNQLTHELMELNNQQTEIPTTKHKPHCLLLDPEEPQCHCSCGLEPAPAQDDSPNMEPEGANAYLVVDPDDNYHICYVVRSKGQALQHATGGLLAFGPITQE